MRVEVIKNAVTVRVVAWNNRGEIDTVHEIYLDQPVATPKPGTYCMESLENPESKLPFIKMLRTRYSCSLTAAKDAYEILDATLRK